MVSKKSITKSVHSDSDERAKDKTLKSAIARKKSAQPAPSEAKRAGKKNTPAGNDKTNNKASEKSSEPMTHQDDDAGGTDRLRAYLRASNLSATHVKSLAAAVTKLIDLAATNRSGLQACLGYINSQPSSSLPAEAPEYFRNRPIDPATGKRETIVKFLERVWQHPWIAERLLTRTALRKLDLPAATALNNFLHAPKERWEPKNELPPHLVVPTKSEVNDALLEDSDRVREARRIVDARWRRQRGLVRGKK